MKAREAALETNDVALLLCLVALLGVTLASGDELAAIAPNKVALHVDVVANRSISAAVLGTATEPLW